MTNNKFTREQAARLPSEANLPDLEVDLEVG